MTPCRAYLALCALSLAFGCMVGLVVANRLLLALDDAQGRSSDTLMTGGPPDIYDFEHLAPNGGTMAYISERN